jgi:hypothetical protein
VHKVDNLTTFTCRLSWNLGASNSWSPQGMSRPVMGLLFLTYNNKSPLKVSVLLVQMWTTDSVLSQNTVQAVIASSLSRIGRADSFHFYLSSGVMCWTSWTLHALRHSVLWNASCTVYLEMLSSKLAHFNHCFGTVQEPCMCTQQLDLVYWIVLGWAFNPLAAKDDYRHCMV